MCDSIPIRTVFATTDDTLYEEYTQKWYWETDNKDIYVGIGCGTNPPSVFRPMTVSPFVWNYCKISGCSYLTDTLIISFTFDPTSKNPDDYLEYILDIPSARIVSRPTNKIKDLSGNILELDIESATIHGRDQDAILEIWLGRGSSRGAFLPELINKNNFSWISLLEKIGLGLAVGIFIILIVYLIKVLKKV